MHTYVSSPQSQQCPPSTLPCLTPAGGAVPIPAHSTPHFPSASSPPHPTLPPGCSGGTKLGSTGNSNASCHSASPLNCTSCPCLAASAYSNAAYLERGYQGQGNTSSPRVSFSLRLALRPVSCCTSHSSIANITVSHEHARRKLGRSKHNWRCIWQGA